MPRSELTRLKHELNAKLVSAESALDAAKNARREAKTSEERKRANEAVPGLEKEVDKLKRQRDQVDVELKKLDLFQDLDTHFDPNKVVGSAVNLCPAEAASVESLAQVAARLNQGTDRDSVIKQIRDVSLAEDQTRPYSGYLHAKDIDENRWAFEQARQILRNSGADVVLGLERGGKMLSETALAGMGEDRPALETIEKANVKKGPENRAMIDQMKALAASGKKNLSMIDVNMGGGSYNWMKAQAEQAMQELKAEGKDEGVTVTIIMLSEQFGFPKNVQDGAQLDPTVKTPGVTGVFLPVRFVGGDDVDRIAGANHPDDRPLGVFDDAGHAAPIEKNEQNGQTPREQFIKLMNP
jgi:hypothetical protein